MRILKADLIEAIASANTRQAESISPYFFRWNHHTGWHRVDLYRVESDGQTRCIDSFAAGTPRECIEKLRNHGYLGYRHNTGKLTKSQALFMLKFVGFDFSEEYLKSRISDRIFLKLWSKVCGYSYKSLNNSVIYHFFKSLQKIEAAQ